MGSRNIKSFLKSLEEVLRLYSVALCHRLHHREESFASEDRHQTAFVATDGRIVIYLGFHEPMTMEYLLLFALSRKVGTQDN